MIFVLLMLCGCSQENSDTRFLLDTAVSLTADCDGETLEAAFKLCEELEAMLSRTKKSSDISRINAANGATSVSTDTEDLVRRALYFGQLSGGKFDITICPVSELWDFKNQVVPDRDEISAALKSVDYEGVTVENSTVNAGDKRLDLGGIAKGYIADRLLDFFKEQGVKSGKLDLGGNLVVFGERDYNIGIVKPFSENTLAATLRLRNKCVVTAGVYERCFENDGRLYHHILDPETGYPAETDLYSATVIGGSAADCDALSTACILLGREKAAELIEGFSDTEAIFIDREQNLYCTSGLELKNGVYTLK